MLTEESTFVIQDVNPETKTISVTILLIVKRDGVEIARSSNTRAFAPGQIEDVKTYIGVTDSPEITYLESIWTQEVIDAYAQRMADATL